MARFSASRDESSSAWLHIYVGVVLTTIATILLELSLTRIFSVVFYYHFAFLAISIALFGLGAGGLFSYGVRGRAERLYGRLGKLAVLNGVAVLLTIVFVLGRHGEPQGSTPVLVYLLSALPFFLAGTVLSTVVAETAERVHRVYFFDLLGAAGGCLLLVPLFDLIGGPNTVIAAAALFAASAALWFTLAGSLRGRVGAVVMALVLVALVVFNTKRGVIDVSYAKGAPLLRELYVKWNSFSRTALVAGPAKGRTSIQVDGVLSSVVADLDPDHLSDAERHALLAQGAGLAYRLRPGAKTLILGPGGGCEIVRALASGSRDITAVESNPIIADTIMRGRFAALSHRLYFHPGVRIVVGDGRSFLRATQQRYGVLRVMLTNVPASAAAGALALRENNLFTTEAFSDYLTHLTADGIMAFTHRRFDRPWESLGLVALAKAAFRANGDPAVAGNVIVVADSAGGDRGARTTVLISRSRFTRADLALVRREAAAGSLRLEYLPGDGGRNRFAKLLAGGHGTPTGRAPDDVELATDNQPFFFYMVQPGNMRRLLGGASLPAAATAGDGILPLLLQLVGISILATAIILLLPPLFLGDRLPRDRGVKRYLWYFTLIGAGYVVIEVSLIQIFILLLGNPTYALTVILFALLVSSGLGSFASRRVIGSSDSSLAGMLAAVALLVALLAVLIPPLSSTGLGWPLWVRIGLTVALVSPAGFTMGMAFPAGIARLEKLHRPSLRWAWALNAAASVMGSAWAVFLGLHVGLRETLLVGGVLYLGALVCIGNPRRRAAAD